MCLPLPAPATVPPDFSRHSSGVGASGPARGHRDSAVPANLAACWEPDTTSGASLEPPQTHGSPKGGHRQGRSPGWGTQPSLGLLPPEGRYLEWSEGHAGGGSRRAVADGGLPTVHHALFLQGPLRGGQGAQVCGLRLHAQACPHPRGLARTCSVLEILALVASFTCVCRTRPLPDLPRWPRLKPRSSW